MARKQPPEVATPRRMTPAGAAQKSAEQQRDADRAAKRRRRLFAPRLGWGGRFGGRAPVEDSGTVYTGPSTQVSAVYPFLLGAGLPPKGVPVGRDVLTGELVCIDPSGWTGRLTTNPGVWVMAQPGAGKSALVKRICLVYSAYGYMLCVPGDVKGEYSQLVSELGGSVVRIGDGAGRLNPLDSGPLKNHLSDLTVAERNGLLDILNGRRLETLTALLATKNGLGRAPNEIERSALNTAVQLAADADAGADPIIPDVITVLRQAPEELRSKLAADGETYKDLTRSVVAGLDNLVGGPLKGLFDGPTTVPLDLHAPAVSVDISGLRARGNDVISAGMIATWAYAYSSIDSARSIGLMNRKLVLPMDEMWRALRSGPGLVDAMDAISRLNRTTDDVTMYVTHSLLDSESLPTEEDRAKARGLMDRCDTWVIGASSAEELRRVTGKRALTEQEQMMIASWSSATSSGLDTSDQVHPGRGKYLIKIGTRPGIAAATELTAVESRLYMTDNNVQLGEPRR
ncbi:ATP-binding protein [Streptomyces caniscabiei]|uniref:ATP-binding protein n=1 Tax=Streptomyces caniscabiei TaxID=2746961 RepID=UPI0029B9F0E4|nr:ATP-binding protein [Streptomyces caniscabiei]MDX2601939.1 ATP-binding protein [Streptomyces caniscabiei]MDX2737374.1 ATP-binding protein [Streptomyces caniscabiei]MDX2777783.1 ATP-binding protein [Streptomyces caniscabiei]